MKLVKIFMKSGNIIEFETDDLVTSKDALIGGLKGMQWIRHGDHIDLEYINPDEVEGITMENIKNNEIKINNNIEVNTYGDIEGLIKHTEDKFKSKKWIEGISFKLSVNLK